MEITATLTRFHKIEERFKAKRYELETQVRRLLSEKQIILTKGMTTVPLSNRVNTEKAIKLLHGIHNLSDVVCKIRAALGKKNAELGISDLLAELEQQRYVRTLASQFKSKGSEGLYGRERTIGYDVEHLGDILASLNSMSEAEPITLSLKGVHTSFEQDVEDIVEQYDSRINELSDTISDRNKEKITLDIPDEYAAIAGVAGK